MSLPKVLPSGADGRRRVAALPELDRLEGPTFHDGARGLAGAGTLVFGGADRFMVIDHDPARTGRELSCNGLDLALSGPAPSFDILVDGSVIEIFCGDGGCLTARAYGDAGGRFRIEVTGGFASGTLAACAMTPISPDRLTS